MAATTTTTTASTPTQPSPTSVAAPTITTTTAVTPARITQTRTSTKRKQQGPRTFAHPILRITSDEIELKAVEALVASTKPKESVVYDQIVHASYETAELAMAALATLRAAEVEGKKLKARNIGLRSSYKALPGWIFKCECGAEFALSQKGAENAANKHASSCLVLYPILPDVTAPLEVLQRLEILFTEFYKQINITNGEANQRFFLMNILYNIIAHTYPGAEIYHYGSTYERTTIPGEPLELTVIAPANQQMTIPNLHALLTKAQVPNITQGTTHFPAIVQTAPGPDLTFTFNLILNRDICIFTTQLLYDYMSLDRRVHPLAVAFKTWGQSVDLYSKKTWLCSLCLELLVIYYLQTRQQPLLPNLQKDIEHTPAEQCRGGFSMEGENCFWRAPQFYKQHSFNKPKADLLLQLFHFYGKEFNFAKNMVSIRIGGPAVSPQEQPPKKPALMFVEDPFTHANVALALKKISTFAKLCAAAYDKLAATGDLRDLLYGAPSSH